MDNKKYKNSKIGVLIINLGTPDNTSFFAIRRYLKEFLSDQRVIEVPKIIWSIILNLFILTFRTSKTAHAYKQIWMNKTNESPLRYYTRMQAKEITKLLDNDNLIIDWAMRYGKPSIEEKIHKLQEQNCQKILILPLYPQYSATTTASVCDKVFQILSNIRWQPTIRICHPYYDHKLYIDALAKTIKDHMSNLPWKADNLIASFHGIPKAYFEKGDPYYCHCHKTARLLSEKLKFDNNYFKLTFQSRFGPKEWLQPYTSEVVVDLAKNGCKNLAIIMPGFSADCLETLEEIAIGIKDLFLENGGKNFTTIPCLNYNEHHIKLLSNIIDNNIKNW